MGNPSRTVQDKAVKLRSPIKGRVRPIDAQPKMDDCDYVFPSRAKTPFSGFGNGKATLDRAVFAAMKRHAKKGAKVVSLPSWTLTTCGEPQRP